MPRLRVSATASRLALIAATSALALAACNQQGAQTAATNTAAAPPPLAALALSTEPPPPLVTAPSAQALAGAPPARVGRLANRGDAYAFADRAHAMNRGFGDAPPDYTFDYENGERPWVWQGDDRSMRVAEPLPDGGDRYYYYEPGAADPYLVQDGGYGYG